MEVAHAESNAPEVEVEAHKPGASAVTAGFASPGAPNNPAILPGLATGVVRRSSDGDDPLGGSAIPGDVQSALKRRAGGGKPLPAKVAESMGDALGHDLSAVRVHDDGEAADISRSVQAEAFTHGTDIYFGQGKFSPGSSGGQRLLAHELSHVVDAGSDAGGGVIGKANDPAERAADASADKVMSTISRSTLLANQLPAVGPTQQLLRRFASGDSLRRTRARSQNVLERPADLKISGSHYSAYVLSGDDGAEMEPVAAATPAKPVAANPVAGKGSVYATHYSAESAPAPAKSVAAKSPVAAKGSVYASHMDSGPVAAPAKPVAAKGSVYATHMSAEEPPGSARPAAAVKPTASVKPAAAKSSVYESHRSAESEPAASAPPASASSPTVAAAAPVVVAAPAVIAAPAVVAAPSVASPKTPAGGAGQVAGLGSHYVDMGNDDVPAGGVQGNGAGGAGEVAGLGSHYVDMGNDDVPAGGGVQGNGAGGAGEVAGLGSHYVDMGNDDVPAGGVQGNGAGGAGEVAGLGSHYVDMGNDDVPAGGGVQGNGAGGAGEVAGLGSHYVDMGNDDVPVGGGVQGNGAGGAGQVAGLGSHYVDMGNDDVPAGGGVQGNGAGGAGEVAGLGSHYVDMGNDDVPVGGGVQGNGAGGAGQVAGLGSHYVDMGNDDVPAGEVQGNGAGGAGQVAGLGQHYVDAGNDGGAGGGAGSGSHYVDAGNEDEVPAGGVQGNGAGGAGQVAGLGQHYAAAGKDGGAGDVAGLGQHYADAGNDGGADGVAGSGSHYVDAGNEDEVPAGGVQGNGAGDAGQVAGLGQHYADAGKEGGAGGVAGLGAHYVDAGNDGGAGGVAGSGSQYVDAGNEDGPAGGVPVTPAGEPGPVAPAAAGEVQTPSAAASSPEAAAEAAPSAEPAALGPIDAPAVDEPAAQKDNKKHNAWATKTLDTKEFGAETTKQGGKLEGIAETMAGLQSTYRNFIPMLQAIDPADGPAIDALLTKHKVALGTRKMPDVPTCLKNAPSNPLLVLPWLITKAARHWETIVREELPISEAGVLDRAALRKRLVKYDETEEQQAETAVSYSGGKLIRDGKSKGPVDTKDGVTHFSGPGSEIFVVSKTGQMHVDSHKVGLKHHSSLLAGGEIAMAGEINVTAGKINWMSNKSGHYEPSEANFIQLLKWMQKDGIAMDFRCIVGFHPNLWQTTADKLLAGVNDKGEEDATLGYEFLRTGAVWAEIKVALGDQDAERVIADLGWKWDGAKLVDSANAAVPPKTGRALLRAHQVRVFRERQAAIEAAAAGLAPADGDAGAFAEAGVAPILEPAPKDPEAKEGASGVIWDDPAGVQVVAEADGVFLVPATGPKVRV